MAGPKLYCLLFGCIIFIFYSCYTKGKIQVNSERPDIKKVHIVFMNHLDVGYANFINVILNEYFMQYFDRAILLAHQLHEGSYTETFIYTTHPWLVSLYVNCPENLKLSNYTLKCPNSTQLSGFYEAVQKGIITWHAGPMNMQMENLDQSLLEFGLNLSLDLDKRFNIVRKYRTLSQRDVPGMTQSVIPSLIKNGIVGVTVGVNPATAPPAVPRLFQWWYEGQSVITLYHPGGYPNDPGVDPGHPGGLSRQDCTIVDGFSEALCFAFRTDNSGPPESLQELLGYYEILRAEFPGSQLVASNLETYMAALYPHRDKLPDVRSEIGDTWVQGIASDPRKMAEYRAVRTVLQQCLTSGVCSSKDDRVINARRFLLKVPEHTWGLPTVKDIRNWSNVAFKQASQGGNFKNCSLSWEEQRNITYIAIESLGNHSVVSKIKAELAKLKPEEPDLRGFKNIPLNPQTVYSCGDMKIGFSSSGAINNLQYKQVDFFQDVLPGKICEVELMADWISFQEQWASSEHLLSQFMYITYNETDIEKLAKVYNYAGSGPGYTKENMTANAQPDSWNWPVSLTELYQNTGNPCDIYVHLSTVDSEPVKKYGAPHHIWIHYSNTPSGVDVDLQVFGKVATRLPEALMLQFSPIPHPGHHFLLSKVGNIVDPLNVVQNGSQYQHALDKGFYYVDGSLRSGIHFGSQDVPLACISTTEVPASPYPAPLRPIQANITGISFNICNNIWNTNYIFWYPYLVEDADFRTRFSIEFLSS